MVVVTLSLKVSPLSLRERVRVREKHGRCADIVPHPDLLPTKEGALEEDTTSH
jgi:hypothetical protein